MILDAGRRAEKMTKGELRRNAREQATIEERWHVLGDGAPPAKPPKSYKYIDELVRLQFELIKLQEWVRIQKLRVVVLFEGRDAAGKGGVIKRIKIGRASCRERV